MDGVSAVSIDTLPYPSDRAKLSPLSRRTRTPTG
jgi:hypothetical protein